MEVMFSRASRMISMAHGFIGKRYSLKIRPAPAKSLSFPVAVSLGGYSEGNGKCYLETQAARLLQIFRSLAGGGFGFPGPTSMLNF